ncbi:hypothetical protein ANTPLA_LOCUS9180 [Anthophora plagiata]
MLKTLRTFANISKTRKDLWIKPIQRCSTGTNSIIEKNNVKVSSFKENHILNILNTSDLNEMTRYIQKPCAEKIILHRMKNGLFKSLNDLTSIQDIELDALNGLWILPIDEVQYLKLKRSMLIPKTKIIKVPNEVLGLHIGSNVISWAVVTSDFKILYLDFIHWGDSVKNVNSHDLINLAPTVAKMLPPSSSYVIEEFPYVKNSASAHLMQQKLSAAIMCCVKILNEQRKKETSLLENDFYVLKSQTSAQFFNLLVGKEVIATKYIIGKVFDNSKIKAKPFEGLYVNDKLRSKFANVTPEQQEQIGWSLLKAITCMYLLKCFKKNEK